MSKKIQVATDTSLTQLLVPENPHVHFFKTYRAKKIREATWSKMIKDDILSGNFHNIKRFIDLAHEYDFIQTLKIAESDDAGGYAFSLISQVDPLIKDVVSIEPGKYQAFTISYSSLWLNNDAYFHDPQAEATPDNGLPKFKYTGRGKVGGVECGRVCSGSGNPECKQLCSQTGDNCENTQCPDPDNDPSTPNTNLCREACVSSNQENCVDGCEDPQNLFYLMDPEMSTSPGHIGEMVIPYRTLRNDTIKKWFTGLPYKDNSTPENGVLIIYSINDDNTKLRTFYTKDKNDIEALSGTITDAKVGAPIIPILIKRDKVQIYEDPDSDKHKHIKQMLKVLGIDYPEFAIKIINGGNEEPPPNPPVTDEDKSKFYKLKREYNKSEYLKQKYATFDDQLKDAKEQHDKFIANGGNTDVVDIVFEMHAPLENMGYGGRIASFETLMYTFGRFSEDNYIYNPKYNRSGGGSRKKLKSYFFGMVHDYFNFMFDVGDYSIKIWEVDKDVEWHNTPKWEITISEKTRGHLLKAHKTCLTYGGDKDSGLHTYDPNAERCVPDYNKRQLITTVKEATHWLDMLSSQSGGSGNTATKRRKEAYMKNGFIRLARQIPFQSKTKERYMEIVLHSPLVISVIGKDSDSVIHRDGAMAYISFDQDGNEMMLRKMFIPLVSDVFMDTPFFYYPALLRDITSIQTHYLHEEEIPWYRTWIFKLLLGLLVAIVTAAVTGTPIGTAVLNYVVSTAVGVAISYIAKSFGMEELAIIVTLIISVVASGGIGSCSMDILDLASNMLDAFGQLYMTSIEKDFEALQKKARKFKIKAYYKGKQLRSAEQAAGMNKVDLGSFNLFIARLKLSYQTPKDFRNITTKKMRPSLIPARVNTPIPNR